MNTLVTAQKAVEYRENLPREPRILHGNALGIQLGAPLTFP